MNLMILINSWLNINCRVITKYATISKVKLFHQLNIAWVKRWRRIECGVRSVQCRAAQWMIRARKSELQSLHRTRWIRRHAYSAPTLPRYSRGGANYVSDTYRIPIRGGYTTDTYRRSIRKKKWNINRILIWVRIGYSIERIADRESRGSASDRPIQRKGRLYGLFGGLLGWTFLVSSFFSFLFSFSYH